MREFLAATLLLVAAGCSPFSAINTLVPDDTYQREIGIAYGENARHTLDVYRPSAPTDGPVSVVVFFYGGSWKGGEKESYVFVGEALASQGFVAVLPDYRIYPEVTFPAFIDDAARAVAWTRVNIARYGGDPSRIFLMGHSAGAHTATMLAYDPDYLAAAGMDRAEIRGVIGLAGPYAFDPLKYRSVRPVFAGLEDGDRARPIAFADAGAPPTLLLHGDTDGTVYLWNSEQLEARLREKGGAVQFIEYDDVGHFGIVLSLAKPFRSDAPVLKDTSEFVRKWEGLR